MTKTDITRKLVEKYSDCTKKEITEFVEDVFNIIKDALIAGEKVQVYGFGTFDIKNNAARERKIPSTGEIKMCPAYKSVKFKAASSLKDAVKG